jgi:hypothetical protein
MQIRGTHHPMLLDHALAADPGTLQHLQHLHLPPRNTHTDGLHMASSTLWSGTGTGGRRQNASWMAKHHALLRADLRIRLDQSATTLRRLRALPDTDERPAPRRASVPTACMSRGVGCSVYVQRSMARSPRPPRPPCMFAEGALSSARDTMR